MRNLIEFIFRNGVFLVFIGLEVLCINLVVSYNQEQSRIYHNSTTRITGLLTDRISSINRYWGLKAANDSLRNENAILRQKLLRTLSIQASTPQFVSNTGDTIRTVYNVYPASVIQNSISNRNNYITLDKGSSVGIKPGMGVGSDDSPIGIVVGTSRNFSRVMSVLHANAMISAAVKSKGYFGSLVWRGFNPGRMQLDAIPKHAQLQVGDTIITSGYSQVFPKDLMIGTIDTFWLPRGSNFYRIEVELYTDMSKLRSAYVYDNTYGEEIKTLENTVDDGE